MTTTPERLPRRHFFARLAAAATGLGWLAGRPSPAHPQGEPDVPYIGEIRMFAGSFAPIGWLKCEGQELLISGQYENLFTLLGTTYGGDGQTTFGLPDLRGRAPVHMEGGFSLGETAGDESLFITTGQMPQHVHTVHVSSAPGVSDLPAGRVPARNAAGTPQYRDTADVTLSTNALQIAGGSQPHENMQPSLVITFIIAFEGVYPSPT